MLTLNLRREETHMTRRTQTYQGLLRKDGLPRIGYTFCDLQHNAVIERYGGLAELTFLPVLRKRGAEMPNQMDFPLFGQGWWGQAEALYTPVMRFLSVQADGAVLMHAPLDEVEIFPFGCRGGCTCDDVRLGYQFAMGDDVLAWRLDNTSAARDELRVVVHPQGLFSGTVAATRDQSHDDWNSPGGWENARETLAMKPFAFHKRHGLLAAEGKLTTPEGVEPVTLVIAAHAPLALDTQPNPLVLSMPWTQARRGRAEVYLIRGRTFRQCLTKLAALRADTDHVMKRQLKRYAAIDRRLPRLETQHRPGTSVMLRQMPLQMESLLVTESPRYLTVRGASRNFGVFWCWDMLQPARAFAAWGERERARKTLAFCLAANRSLETGLPVEVGSM